MNAPKEIAGVFSALGVAKAETKTSRLFLLAVLAGAFIALAGLGSTIANTLVNKLAGACVFPAGLAMVVVAGSELFTGDNLMIISVLDRKITLKRMLLVLLIVYIGNFYGAYLVVLISAAGGSFDAIQEAVVAAAVSKATLGFGAAFVRGVLCNFLVCIAVWMAAAAKEPVGKILGVFFPIMLFVLCGFEHSVANMYYLPAGLLTAVKFGIPAEGLTLGSAILGNLIPVTLGNMVGGMLVGVCYWGVYRRGQTVKEDHEDTPRD